MPVDHRGQGTLPDGRARWRAATRIRRVAILLGALGMIAGTGLVTAGLALAAGVGSEPGNLALSPAQGPIGTTPTWATTDGCPSTNQVSAQLAEFDTSGNEAGGLISPAVGNVTSAFSGTLDSGATVGNLLS